MWGGSSIESISNVGPVPYTADDGYSWIVALLPYMEESQLYNDLFEASNKFQQPMNSEVIKKDGKWIPEARIDSLVCPSMSKDYFAKGMYAPLTRPQISNYVALAAGCAEGNNQRFSTTDSTTAGVLVTKDASTKGLKIGDIKDGTSRTVMLTESKAELYSFWYSGRSVTTVAMPPDQSPCDTKPPGPSGLNFGRHKDGKPNDPWFATRYPPGKIDWGPSSHHPGSILHGFADGRVKGLNDDTDPEVYFAMVTCGAGDWTDGPKEPAQ